MATSLEQSDQAVALRQLIILERGFPVATKTIVVGEPLTPQEAPALLDELDRLESSWKAQYNDLPRHAHARLSEAFERMKIPFLSAWERLELEIREAIAGGMYDDPATWREKTAEGVWLDDLWLVTMLGGAAGEAKAKAIAAADPEASAWDRWLVDGKLDAASTSALRDRFAAAKAKLEAKPVKTAEKLDRQIGAFLATGFDRAILDKSFKQWFGYCYHAGSPSNFSDKQAHILAHNLFVFPSSPSETLAFVRSCLAFFTPARTKLRRVRRWDVEPIREELLAWRRLAEGVSGQSK